MQRVAALAERRQATALRRGTINNHKSVLTKFVRFLARAEASFLCPTQELLCMFLEECMETARSPATAKNYVSALSSCYKRMGLDPSVFESFKVRNALTSIDKNVHHVPTPSLPVTPALLKRIVRVVRAMPNGVSLSAAYILMFHTFYRQSNFAAATSAEFDPSRQLTRQDITIHKDSLRVNRKWSKSHQRAGHTATTIIPQVPNSVLCPKVALLAMLRVVPTCSPLQPLLCFDDGSHIPLSYLRRVWNAVLSSLNIPHYERYSLHGLRRGAATHVMNSDPSARDQVKQHGLWRSDAVDAYIPKPCDKVFTTMRDTL